MLRTIGVIEFDDQIKEPQRTEIIKKLTESGLIVFWDTKSYYYKLAVELKDLHIKC